jgi:pimeloyl-ACP methyl ester carboxylesterase
MAARTGLPIARSAPSVRGGLRYPARQRDDGRPGSVREPERIGKLVLVGPSPCYIDDVGYTGGFSRADIDEMLEVLDSNFLGWSSSMAPVIIGNPDRPELGEELASSFCRTDPDIAARFARVTFLSDNRGDLAGVGVYVHRRIPGRRSSGSMQSGTVPT